MPLYHFNVYDGITLLDRRGTDLPNTMFARREAIRYSGSLLEEGSQKDRLGQDWRMEVTDDTGLIMFRLEFHVTDAPAASRSSTRS